MKRMFPLSCNSSNELSERMTRSMCVLTMTCDSSSISLRWPNQRTGEVPSACTRSSPSCALPIGCPWDRAQDWPSLAPKVVEEAYEVVDAIADGDAGELASELGDLLLIVALLTQIAEEQDAFTIEDVYETVNRKLIRRHPHVFGDEAAETPEAVLSTWHRVKREERGATAKPRSKYDRLPKSMPAIAKAVVMRDDAGELIAESGFAGW